ncbi:crotonobetainyl-CoA:carnitine CoA-transferase CaiB-like acyl-CoA transferase [Caldalkalibacillus uzonensis]|uniref:Crotonobetainyl-CoA:carnitine CoA-transferase CaiB-like acyl-CoA transferase n=1 Tax=Caldalkalibacillus uzonensis TaxID=353224 RepID=A0ABU0CU72_9BACI|nr:CoA transferase [Caldalkalibacillus uzonensis]MDQ0339956.1 crotonobetainyl-CoA:carnitine CoA-transferase CaiB-like acyl-CoA transferase [Caldalkalibacillus uzonensis]
MGALSKMKVIDLTQVLSGPYCTMVLGDMGAEVIKVEKYPHGDDTRQMGPFIEGESACYMMVNRNKKGMRVNLKHEKGKQILYRLVESADVLVENFRPGVAAKLGIDYETLKEINPGLIYCSISGYGQTGPYRNKGGFDIMAQGLSGIMSMTGEQGGEPVKVGIAIHDIAAAMTALYHILVAYIHKLNIGEGQYIDISLVDSGLAWTVWEAAAYFGAGEIPRPNGTRHRVSAPYQGFRTQDGSVLVGAANQKLWEKFCLNVVGKPEWITDPRFREGVDRQANVDTLAQLIQEIFITKPSQYWLDKMEAEGIPCGPILSYDQALQNEHILARDMVQEVEHPVAGKVKTLGFPGKLSATPGHIYRPAPTLGQHSEEILQSLRFSAEEIKQLQEEDVI